ncbi:uncharacterized protein LOC126843222 isoform X2 [Adelges cooleyi]|uniref:uncharacterized protein LOC126843222 isoform X2 n=1 Tax=Adelges cooleyi TaxID=133065 RepID=UPI00217FC3E2|nr:uncharacterized protein LOC126843222 isoform X2 [Adelges cooleyi]
MHKNSILCFIAFIILDIFLDDADTDVPTPMNVGGQEGLQSTQGPPNPPVTQGPLNPPVPFDIDGTPPRDVPGVQTSNEQENSQGCETKIKNVCAKCGKTMSSAAGSMCKAVRSCFRGCSNCMGEGVDTAGYVCDKVGTCICCFLEHITEDPHHSHPYRL